MTKKLVIVGSATLQEKISYWKLYWEKQGLDVVDYPAPIPIATFIEDYPQVHRDFFRNLEESDVVFVMNEDKKNIKGYIGAESFAEMAYAVAQNQIHQKNIEILLLQMPEAKVQSFEEVALWLKLGWVKLFEN